MTFFTFENFEPSKFIIFFVGHLIAANPTSYILKQNKFSIIDCGIVILGPINQGFSLYRNFLKYQFVVTKFDRLKDP